MKRTMPLLLALALMPSGVLAEGGTKDLTAPGTGDRTPPSIITTVTGAVPLAAGGPVALEYAESPKLTALLARALAEQGIRVAERGAAPPASVRVRGVLQLTGKHTARIRIAELAEQGTLFEAGDASRVLVPADLGYVIAASSWLDRLVDTGRLAAPVGAVLLLDVAGQATGAKDWFNKAVGGDRRGICLLNCEHWQKTRQAALHVIEIDEGGTRHRAEVKSELFAEALEPGRVVSASLAAVVTLLAGKHASGALEVRTQDGRAPN